MTENSHQTLVVELLTEELPPKHLLKLSTDFAQNIINGLKINHLIDNTSNGKTFATPRRIAVMIQNVLSLTPVKKNKRKIMPTSFALNDDGTPTEALKKKMASIGKPLFSIDILEKNMEGGVEFFFYEDSTPIKNLSAILQNILEKTIEKLNDYKKMQYQLQNGESVSFIRPVTKLMAIHGKNVLNVKILGLLAGRKTLGHRFLCKEEIIIDQADSYENDLAEKGKVIACYKKRQLKIIQELEKFAKNAQIVTSKDLLDEVTALVEWPCVYTCHFDKSFLSVPKECLIFTMQTQQRYFGLSDQNGQLLSSFLVVSNIETSTPEQIIRGNERVIRPRFADAKFFFEQDKLIPLHQRVNDLKNITYHQKLGSQFDRVNRLKLISRLIFANIKDKLPNCEYEHVNRASLLAKADLTTNMVVEFPELQGIMGNYYALADGEQEDVAKACAEHYQPRYAGDSIPKSSIGKIIAIADKIEILLSMVIVEGLPKNDKDPLALRRHALGLMRILTEGMINIQLLNILNLAFNELVSANMLPNTSNPSQPIFIYCIDRLKYYFYEKKFTWSEINAVFPSETEILEENAHFDLVSIFKKLKAIQKFNSLDEAHALASINKRIRNILAKSSALNKHNTSLEFDRNIATKQEELNLADKINQLSSTIESYLANEDFDSALHLLIKLRKPIDIFFDKVIVNANDELIKNNRLNLLNKAYQLMNTIADISAISN